MKNLGKLVAALTLGGMAIPAGATTLTLTGPVADADQIQQTAQTPRIFAGATPTQPAGFGYEKFSVGGGSQTYDARTGTGAVDWNNGVVLVSITRSHRLWASWVVKPHLLWA